MSDHPIPDNWEHSLSAFKNRGLSNTQLRTAWEAAKGKDDPWLYFCGVCWNMVYEGELIHISDTQ